MTSTSPTTFAAEKLLARLKANGTDHLFATGGSDFAPIVECLANGMAKQMAMPVPIIAPHETAALGNLAAEFALPVVEFWPTRNVLPIEFTDLAGPNRCFNMPLSGGLGWGMPAALGASLADRDRLVIACMGDGSYIFANPVACHHIAEAHGLPVLFVVMNNGMWNSVRRATLSMYPKGQAAGMDVMPITSLEPSPDYAQVVKASRGWSETVENAADLPGAIARAIAVIKTEKRQAVLNVIIAATA